MNDVMLADWITVLLRVLAIAVAAAVAIWLGRRVLRISVRRLLEREEHDESLGVLPQRELQRRVATIETLTTRVATAVIGIIAVLMILQTLGIEIGAAIAGLGVVGIAVGLGAQTLVKDWLSGIFVVLENQYSRGDVVSVAGVTGSVEDFSLRRTTLRDLSGTVHTVPNGAIVVASNLTRVWARVNLDVSVGYDTDIERATAVIDRIGAEMLADETWSERMIEAPGVVRVDALGDSGVTLKVLGQVRAAEQWAVAGELRKRILATFAREGIEIPFPHRVMISRSVGSGPGEPAAEAGRRDATDTNDAGAIVAD